MNNLNYSVTFIILQSLQYMPLKENCYLEIIKAQCKHFKWFEDTYIYIVQIVI